MGGLAEGGEEGKTGEEEVVHASACVCGVLRASVRARGTATCVMYSHVRYTTATCVREVQPRVCTPSNSLPFILTIVLVLVLVLMLIAISAFIL